MSGRWIVAIVVGLTVGVGTSKAQDVGAENLPGATRVVRPAEVPVVGLVKRDANTVALTLPEYQLS